MTKLRFWLLMALALCSGIVATLVLSSVVERVPDAGGVLKDGRARLEKAGFEVHAVPSPGSSRSFPLPAEQVIRQSPRPGWPWIRGRTITLHTKQAYDEVVVPDLLGRFETDAIDAIDYAGLSRVSQESSDPATSIVTAQAPEPGSVVEFGTVVSYTAVPAHTPNEGTDPGVKALHGVLYLRYGLAGTADACSLLCHTAETCTSCHEDKAYSSLDEWVPNP